MKIRKFTNEELGDKVLFPRTQLRGVNCTDSDSDLPKRQDFNLERIETVDGMGGVNVIVQQVYPRMVFQLFDNLTPAQFDDYLGKLLGMHDTPSYIESRLDFMVLFQGSRDGQEITQENHEAVYEYICKTQDQAARWWHLYGKR